METTYGTRIKCNKVLNFEFLISFRLNDVRIFCTFWKNSLRFAILTLCKRQIWENWGYLCVETFFRSTVNICTFEFCLGTFFFRVGCITTNCYYSSTLVLRWKSNQVANRNQVKKNSVIGFLFEINSILKGQNQEVSNVFTKTINWTNQNDCTVATEKWANEIRKRILTIPEGRRHFSEARVVQ